MENPFKPKEVKLYNYNKLTIDNNKFNSIINKMSNEKSKNINLKDSIKNKDFSVSLRKNVSQDLKLNEKKYYDLKRGINGYKNNQSR